jgi:hypothetical protein
MLTDRRRGHWPAAVSTNMDTPKMKILTLAGLAGLAACSSTPAVTQPSIELLSPADGAVIGGSETTVTAHAVAPNGGPLHVDFALRHSGTDAAIPWQQWSAIC